MDARRIALYAALGFVLYFIVQAWHHDYPEQSPKHNQDLSQGLPDLSQANAKAQNNQPSGISHPQLADIHQVTGSLVEVKTDVIQFKIDLNQGEIIQADLIDYPVSLQDKKPVQILTHTGSHQYVAKNQLVSLSPDGLVVDKFNYKTTAPRYELAPGQNQVVVTLEGQNTDGLKVLKTYTVKKGAYLIEIAYQLVNQGSQNWKGYLNTQLVQTAPPENKSGLFQIGTYLGASYSEPGVHRYQKVTFQDMAKSNLNVTAKGGWIAMQQHYFVSSWIPTEQQKSNFYTRANDDTYTIGTLSDAIHLKPGETTQLQSKLYVGPEITKVLSAISPGLDLTVDYGWFWFISGALFSLMKWIESVIGNWGWSIIAVTVLIKLAFYRLSASSYRSMAGMRQIQPKLQALKERCGDDKAKLSQATMELYRQEKINPLGGCLPIIIQIPVFIALYWVLIESVELRHAPFIFWIQDLAAPDAYHVLPIIMGLTMLIQQRLNPAPPDPMQAKMMMFLPVLFTGIFWNFPAGLVLYWIVNNLLSILQQWWITKRLEQSVVAS